MAKSLKLEYRMEIPDNFDDMLEQSVFVDLDMNEKIIFNLCKCLYAGIYISFLSFYIIIYYLYIIYRFKCFQTHMEW